MWKYDKYFKQKKGKERESDMLLTVTKFRKGLFAFFLLLLLLLRTYVWMCFCILGEIIFFVHFFSLHGSIFRNNNIAHHHHIPLLAKLIFPRSINTTMCYRDRSFPLINGKFIGMEKNMKFSQYSQIIICIHHKNFH